MNLNGFEFRKRLNGMPTEFPTKTAFLVASEAELGVPVQERVNPHRTGPNTSAG